MKFIFLILTSLLSIAGASAANAQPANPNDQIPVAFQMINAEAKGPFGLIGFQKTTGRTSNSASPKDMQFKAGFRSELADRLARIGNFYVGNLFTTNYYELMGEVVYGGYNTSHPIEHTLLSSKAAQANGRASIMVRNWILEKYYVAQFPDSNLAKSFSIKWVSDIETERGFAHLFFDVYLRGLKDDYQYLSAFLLLKDSPISDTPSLNEARDLVAQGYTKIFSGMSSKPAAKSYFEIRNAVHNRLSRDIIPLIDRYKVNFGQKEPAAIANLMQVRARLVEYYSSNVTKISELALKTSNTEIQALASTLTTTHSIHDLLALSRLIADLKTKIASRTLVYSDATESLILVSLATQYMSKEILSLNVANEELPLAVEALINCAYAEGFLITDNHKYFIGELANTNSANMLELFRDISNVSLSTLNEAMKPTLSKWISVEPKMQSFIDSTLKSSALNALSVFADRIANLPPPSPFIAPVLDVPQSISFEFK